MKCYRLTLSSLCVVALSLLITACGGGALSNTGNGGGGNSNSNLKVTTSSMNTGTVGTAYTASLQATGGTAPYTWSLKSGALPAGLSVSADGTVSGTPTAAGTAGSLVFQVTDAGNNSASSGSLSLKVNSAVQVTTASLPSATQGAAYTSSLTATGGSGTYTWTLKSGNLPAGLSLNASTGEISGKPTAANIVSGLVFQATDTNTATGVSASLTLQVYNTLGCSSGAESNLGTQSYAFLIKGFEPSTGNLAPVTVIGSFTTDGKGGITAGEEDINSSGGAQSALAIIPTSSYSLGSDNNGCLLLTTSAGTTNLHFSVSTPNGSKVFTQGHVMLDNSSGTAARGAGILRLQDSSTFTAGLTGMYAFLFVGTDSYNGNFGMAGSFTAASGNFTDVAFDADDAGTLATGVTGGTGTYTTPDANGRGTTFITASGNTYNLNSVYYVVNSTEALFASTDAIATNPISSGRALATNSAQFTTAYLNGNYVGHATGLTTGDVPQVIVITANFDGTNSGTGTVIEDQGGNVTHWPASDFYAVDAATGRITFTGSFIAPVGYLVTGYNGVSVVLVSNDYPATTGILVPQPTDSTPASGTYSFGTDVDADFLTANQVGTFNLNAANFSGTESLSNPVTPFLVQNQNVSSTSSIGTDGTGSFWANHAVSSGSVIYFIDERAGTNTHPAIIEVTK